MAEVGPVVYLGPQFTADRLTTLAVKRNEEISQLPDAPGRHLAQTRCVELAPSFAAATAAQQPRRGEWADDQEPAADPSRFVASA